MSTDEQQALAPLGQINESPRSDIAILVSQAIEQDLDIKKLTELLQAMREQLEIDRKQRAQEAYLKAKSKFLGSCPVINADKRADKFNYPSYGRILEVCLPLMSKVGLSITTTPDFENEIVTCVMKHTLGHEESATFPMTIEGQPPTGKFQLSLQQKWAFALTYAERQSFKAVSGVPTSDSDVDMLPLAERPPSGADDKDPLARTATAAEYEALKAGWWKFAQPPAINEAFNKAINDGTKGHTPEELQDMRDAAASDNARREEFDRLEPQELAELFMAWVCRSIDGVQDGFIKQDKPHTYFTSRQIFDLWAIINKDKEDKIDVSSDSTEKRSDSN